jgi:hypothetical protein
MRVLQHDPFAAQQVHQLAQDVDWPAGDARGLTGVGFEHDPFVEGAEAIAKQPQNRLNVALAGVI